jgi:hypothetical protein
MQLSYNGFSLDSLGEFTVSQTREFEGGEAPQRARVTLTVRLDVFEEVFATNRALLAQAEQALRTANGVLQWSDADTGVDYVNQTAAVLSTGLPEDPNAWGQYHQQLVMVFSYFDQGVATANVPLTFASAGGQPPLALGNVTAWSETNTVDRFSPMKSPRRMSLGKVTASGMILADTTQALADRRAYLAGQKALLDQLDGRDGALAYGAFFAQTVRVDEFTAKIDEAVNAIEWSFTAHYTRFPDEEDYATVEFQAAQRDENTGEQFLDFTGRITATDEATARAKLAALGAAVLAQYGYGGAQQLKNDASVSAASANADGDTFLELTFGQTYRRWRPDNSTATFLPTGAAGAPVALPNIRIWTLHYSAARYNEMRSQRRHASGRIEAGGTVAGDPALPLAQRRAALIAQAVAMFQAVNGADGALQRGAWRQVVRAADFRAEVNQAITGIEWSLSAEWSVFPNEEGYATAEYTASQRDSEEDGDEFLSLHGRILAPSEAAARAKFTSVRDGTLALYGWGIGNRIRGESAAERVYANGDKTAGLSGSEAADGTTFIELTFTEEYRRRKGASVLASSVRMTTRTDATTGLVQTVFAGQVTASGANVGAAYAAALAKANALGGGKEAGIGGSAFLKLAQIGWDERQVRQDGPTEFVKLEFSFEYQSKSPAGAAYLEFSTTVNTDPFGIDTEDVTGYVVAVDFATANALYLSQVRGAYAGRLIRGESLSQAQVQKQAGGGFTAQQLRLEFRLQAYVVKGRVAYRYGITVAIDYLTLEKTTRLHGSAFGSTAAAAQGAHDALVATLAPGSLVRTEAGKEFEFTSDFNSTAFVRLDFDDTYVDRVTGVTGTLEMRLRERVRYSGPRWATQPTLVGEDGTGGFDVPQTISVQGGSRTVEGSATGAVRAEVEAWGKRQRALLTGDANGGFFAQPEEWDIEYDFVPRVDGVSQGVGENVRLWRVDFTFAELLPNYPAPL